MSAESTSTGPENQEEEILARQNEVLNQAAALKDLQGVVEQIKRFKIMYNDFQRQIDELKEKSAQSRGSNNTSGIQSGGFADDPDDGAAGYDDAGLGDAGFGDAGYADAANGGDDAGLADAGYDDAAAGYDGDAAGYDGDAAGGTQVGGAPVAKKVKKSAKTKKTKTKKAKKASA
jgi:hypothetical protein